MKLLVPTLLMLVLPVVTFAHHSRAGYDMSVIQEIEGELVKIVWRNPHPVFTVSVDSEDRGDQLWTVEGWGALYHLQRTGITRENFSVGDRVRVAGFSSTRENQHILGTHVLLSNGTEAILRTDVGSYWTQDHIGGQDRWGVDETQLGGIGAENRGIFRVWSPSGYARSLSTTTRHLPFKESAIKARAAWNPEDNFVTRCEPAGMPLVMVWSVYPHSFEDQGTEILLHSQWWDIKRKIHLTPLVPEEERPASRLGHSAGRWEGRSLIVETTDIDWPYFDARGTPQSKAIEVREEFTLSEDQSRMDYRMTVTDPEVFTEPATIETYWLALGEKIEPYDCLAQ